MTTRLDSTVKSIALLLENIRPRRINLLVEGSSGIEFPTWWWLLVKCGGWISLLHTLMLTVIAVDEVFGVIKSLVIFSPRLLLQCIEANLGACVTLRSHRRSFNTAVRLHCMRDISARWFSPVLYSLVLSLLVNRIRVELVLLLFPFVTSTSQLLLRCLRTINWEEVFVAIRLK